MAATLVAAFETLVGHHLGALSVFFQEADGHWSFLWQHLLKIKICRGIFCITFIPIQ